MITAAQKAELREIVAGLDSVERVRVAHWAFDTIAAGLDDDGCELLAKYMRARVTWGEMPNLDQVQKVRLSVVLSLKERLSELPHLFEVAEPPTAPEVIVPESPPPDADMVLDPSYQKWLAGEAMRAVEELEERSRKAAAESAQLEAQAKAMREAMTPAPAPTAWETNVAGKLTAGVQFVNTEEGEASDGSAD